MNKNNSKNKTKKHMLVHTHRQCSCWTDCFAGNSSVCGKEPYEAICHNCANIISNECLRMWHESDCAYITDWDKSKQVGEILWDERKRKNASKKEGWSDILKANSLHQIKPLILSPSTFHIREEFKQLHFKTERERSWGWKATEGRGVFCEKACSYYQLKQYYQTWSNFSGSGSNPLSLLLNDRLSRITCYRPLLTMNVFTLAGLLMNTAWCK